MNSMQSMGESLRQARVIKGLTQEELASRLGISRVSVSHWERGISVPDGIRLIDLAHILGDQVFDWVAEAKVGGAGSRVRASAGRVREGGEGYAETLRMPQAIYDMVSRRLSQLRSAGVSEPLLSSAERLLTGASTGQTPRDLSTLSEAEWFVMVNAAWAMITTALRIDEESLPIGIPSSTPSIERAEAEAEVFRRLPALPPLEKKKGKRRA